MSCGTHKINNNVNIRLDVVFVTYLIIVLQQLILDVILPTIMMIVSKSLSIRNVAWYFGILKSAILFFRT